MQDIEIFVQGEGCPTISLIRVKRMPPSKNWWSRPSRKGPTI